MKKFPKQIHVTIEHEGTDDEYLNAYASAGDRSFEETTRVAIYQLVEVGKVVVQRRFESGKRRPS